jgi:histidinol-phosphate phosphatase family protein
VTFDVVVPTAGRASLARTLAALPGLDPIVVRDDGRGPAAARNRGWRRSQADWVAFLDDDVVPDPGWAKRLADDLAELPDDVGGSQGRLRVPLPARRRPTDWERNVARLESACWATADMAFRRAALESVGGFDERFPRAFREDTDLALRLERAGWRLVRGRRTSAHPVRHAGVLDSVRLQAGNADDALMEALHGRDWYERAGAPRGRRLWHLATTAAGVAALALRSRAILLVWLGLTADFAVRRIAPGPRTPREVASLLLTSILIPPAASVHWLRGRHRASRLAAVLVDRDGTLVYDVPYNADPDDVRPIPGARAALERLRAARVPVAVVSNQSGVGRGLLTRGELDAVNRRVEELLGPFAGWFVCTHSPGEACSCRKPAPGLVLRAAEFLGVPPSSCVVIGDIGADVDAARAVGARPILVPTPETRPEEVAAAPEVVTTLGAAVDLVLRRPR